MDIDIDIEFKNQMDFVRERNKIKYENKLMKDQDLYSKNIQHVFQFQRELELQKKNEEEAQKIQQLIIQEQIENEQKQLKIFVESYILNKLNKNKGNLELDVEHLRNEAENLFYDRLLKQQQDDEYNRTMMLDMKFNH